jgi:hypothetical protein
MPWRPAQERVYTPANDEGVDAASVIREPYLLLLAAAMRVKVQAKSIHQEWKCSILHSDVPTHDARRTGLQQFATGTSEGSFR